MDTIRTESDYRTALAVIDGMDDPVRGTPEYERLDRLVDQVEAYESEHYPVGTPSAEAVAEYEAAKRGGGTISNVLSDRDSSLEALASDAEPNEALRLAARAHLEQPSAETQAELSEACLSALVQQAQELNMGY